MTGVEALSWGDAYTIATVSALVGLIAVGVGWAVDRWPSWQAERRQRRSERSYARRFNQSVRSASASVLSPGRLGLRGTVQNPHADPSPTPRTRQ